MSRVKEIRVIKRPVRYVTIIMVGELCGSFAMTEIDFYDHLEECLITHGPIIATAILETGSCRCLVAGQLLLLRLLGLCFASDRCGNLQSKGSEWRMSTATRR